jgi:hypothetical protein
VEAKCPFVLFAVFALGALDTLFFFDQNESFHMGNPFCHGI